VKVYTLLTTTNRFGLPSFVNLCKTLGATGVTVFAFPQSFSPDSTLLSKINVQIGDLQKKESTAASNRDYVLASTIRAEIDDLEAQIKELSRQASAYYTAAVEPIKSFLSTVVLDRESWDTESPTTEDSFIDQITKISQKLTSSGIRGIKHSTPLTKRVFIPLGAVEQNLSQPVAQMASVPSTNDSVVGEVGVDVEPEPSDLSAEPEEPTQDEHGIPSSLGNRPDSLSPNQRAFAEAILIKQASNLVQAANLAGISPSSAKKTATDITKKWPEFPTLIKPFIKSDVLEEAHV
jgi:hypothetical protein